MSSGTVLVPLDGSAEAAAALPVARELAALHGATLRILHVSDRAPAGPELAGVLGLEGAAVRGCVLETRSGDPATAIGAGAGEPGTQLVVLASLGGAVSLRVLRDCACPVVFVAPGRTGGWSLRHLLVPHDGTPATTEALRPAVALARSAGADLHILHVTRPGAAPPGDRGALPAPRYTDQEQYAWPEWTQEFLDRITGLIPLEEVRVRLSMARGRPGEEIARVARETSADLVVLAFRGDLAPSRALLVRRVIASSPCPVYVARAAPPADEAAAPAPP